MEKGKAVSSLIVTGILVVLLALASLVYPKITAWYENLVNGGNEISGTPAVNGSQTGTPAADNSQVTTGTPGQNNNGGNNDNSQNNGNQQADNGQQNNNQNNATQQPTPTPAFAGEPVTVTDVPLAATNGDTGAKDFYIVKSDGTTARLSDFYGKPLVVNIWATWCGYCKEEFPYFDAALKTYGDKVEFLFVDLCDGKSETRAKADKFMASKGYSFPVYYETLDKVLDIYNVGGIPLTLFINSDGTVFRQKLGAFSGQLGLFDTIDRLIKNNAK